MAGHCFHLRVEAVEQVWWPYSRLLVSVAVVAVAVEQVFLHLLVLHLPVLVQEDFRPHLPVLRLHMPGHLLAREEFRLRPTVLHLLERPLVLVMAREGDHLRLLQVPDLGLVMGLAMGPVLLLALFGPGTFPALLVFSDTKCCIIVCDLVEIICTVMFVW